MSSCSECPHGVVVSLPALLVFRDVLCESHFSLFSESPVPESESPVPESESHESHEGLERERERETREPGALQSVRQTSLKLVKQNA